MAWIAARPGQAFAAFLALHAAVWTALPSLLYPNLPLDLIEALMYGREWQIGYDKLPPLPWWLVEITYRLVGHDFAYYLLAQIAVAASFTFVFLMARPLVGGVGALIAVLIVDGLHYLNYTSAKFNHDVVQLPFWALAGYALHRALRGRRNADWLLLGFAIGISLWAKYFVLVLALPMAVFVLTDRDARKCLATPGPYIAIAAALLTMAPHLVWLVQNDFLPFAYAEHRALPSRGLIDHIWHPLQFAISQLFFLIPSLLIALPLFLPRANKSPLIPPQAGIQDHSPGAGDSSPGSPLSRGRADHGADDFDRRIVTWLAFGPIVTVLALSAASGRGTVAMWGYPLWLYLGLWLVLMGQRKLSGARLMRPLAIWAIVFTGLALAFIVNYAVLPNYDHRYRAVFFPGSDLAHELSDRFHTATGKAPVYVIAGMWDGGNVEHYAPSHPRVLIDGKPERAPWIDLGDLKVKGALVVWTAGDPRVIPPEFRTLAAEAAVQEPFTLKNLRGDNTTTVGWAILLPRPSFADADYAVALTFLVAVSSPALSQSPAPAQPAPAQAYTPQYVVTYIEVTPKSADKTAALLAKYRLSSQKAAGAKLFEVFRRVGSPGQFAIVSTWEDTKAYAAHRDSSLATAFRDAIAPNLIAAYDERPHHALNVGKLVAAGHGLVTITHVDIIPTGLRPGIQAVKDLADKGRTAPGNVRFDALTQTSRPNHMTLVQVWKDMKAYEADIVSADVISFRKSLFPRSGSPYDERLYTTLN
jgi:quinol monooxygenase YgiN